MTGLRATALPLALLSLAFGLWLGAEQAWIKAKAQVASVLIERAFEAHLEDGAKHPPWSWADAHPVARLRVPRLGIERTVLSGASGSSMAFGPGHVDGTARPNEPGNAVLAGHRDTWFAFLQDLEPGDAIEVDTRGATRTYVVERMSVRSMWDSGVLAPDLDDRLTLITCYPFDGLSRTELRYVVEGVESVER